MAKKSNKNSRKKSGKNSQASIKDEKNLNERIKYFLVLLLILFLGIIFYLAYVNLVLFPRTPLNSTLNSSQECNCNENPCSCNQGNCGFSNSSE